MGACTCVRKVLWCVRSVGECLGGEEGRVCVCVYMGEIRVRISERGMCVCVHKRRSTVYVRGS